MLFKNKCFIFKGKKGDIKANWTSAQSWCEEQGGDLAVIDSHYENGEQKPRRIKGLYAAHAKQDRNCEKM